MADNAQTPPPEIAVAHNVVITPAAPPPAAALSESAPQVEEEKEAPPSLWKRFTSNKIVKVLWDFIWEPLSALITTFRAVLVLLFQTPLMLLPSVASTSTKDDEYNKQLNASLKGIVENLDLTPNQSKSIKDNWLEQIAWTNNRATRERNANELIRWWQIILGVLIPVIINIPGLANSNTWASLAGIFVAVLTAIYQFRRPEERWQHYRTINERYLNEFWNFIVLSEDVYKKTPNSHQDAFQHFNARMNDIKREEVSKFFSTVITTQQAQQLGGQPGQGVQIQAQPGSQQTTIQVQPAAAAAVQPTNGDADAG